MAKLVLRSHRRFRQRHGTGQNRCTVCHRGRTAAPRPTRRREQMPTECGERRRSTLRGGFARGSGRKAQRENARGSLFTLPKTHRLPARRSGRARAPAQNASSTVCRMYQSARLRSPALPKCQPRKMLHFWCVAQLPCYTSPILAALRTDAYHYCTDICHERVWTPLWCSVCLLYSR
jgi:hypothetical protein